MPLPRRRSAVTAVLLAALALSACTDGDDGEADPEEATPEEVLEVARQTLDETSGLRIDLTADALPQGVQGLSAAQGVITDAPAFDGTLTVVFAGSNVDVPVVAVDGTVHAQIPLTTGWSEVDPAEYGAPDPSRLLDPDTGLPSLLPRTEDLAEGETVRGGQDNREVLTEYTGTVAGDAVADVIPSASGDSFDATYTVTDDGELREAVLTGVFYPDSDPMTYTVGLDDYGTEQEITAP